MNKVISLLLLFLACVGSMQAASLSASQKSDLITRINKKASSLQTLNCSFVQTKYLSLLSDKMVSNGKMYYKKSSKLRWEYTSPYQYLFIFNGTKVYVGNKNRKDVIDTNSNKIFKEVARIMMSTVTGTALSNSSDFSFDIADGGKSYWQVTLVPKKKDMRKMFTKIILSFKKSDLMIAEINLYESNNDRTNIVLKNISTSTPINESLFAIPK